MINLAIAKFLPGGSPKCCQMSISARESKSLKSCCTGVNKKMMKPLMWGLAGTIVPGTKLLEHLITGDQTWLHLSTPETKHDSMTWKHPSSLVTKKSSNRQQK
ncbi:histone-lysine N-methyltransferase SETMAR [Plakobranchus ocellatus]|uniref:Histone-lysine N-methyltransferase SETMAR n=1 Tax=Plakobranchus ocellatus TaxID=259542 RepID=A0AAV3ZSK2_9GAST|nr:histone-lysine N-methyltransferase SETMAR [Plakobranchus ocellatus]